MDEAFLPGNAERRPATGGGVARGADRDVKAEAMVGALLLGRIRDPGRVAVRECVPRVQMFQRAYEIPLDDRLSLFSVDRAINSIDAPGRRDGSGFSGNVPQVVQPAEA